jgi:hypothetical protein
MTVPGLAAGAGAGKRRYLPEVTGVVDAGTSTVQLNKQRQRAGEEAAMAVCPDGRRDQVGDQVPLRHVDRIDRRAWTAIAVHRE